MPSRLEASDANYAIERYASGIPIRQIARELKVADARVSSELKKRGIQVSRRRVSDRNSRFIPIPNELVELYIAGASAKELATRFGISRPCIVRELKRRGIHVRGRSQAEALKWSKMRDDRAAIERQCSAAWERRRGQKVSVITKHIAARTNQRRKTKIGKYEGDILRLLQEAGVECLPQFASGPYNIDIAIRHGSVAVEVIGSYPKAGTVPYRERVPKLIKSGWAILYINLSSKRVPNFVYIRDKIIAFTEAVCSNESMRRKQWVVAGDQKHSPQISLKLEELSGVQCLGYPEDISADSGLS